MRNDLIIKNNSKDRKIYYSDYLKFYILEKETEKKYLLLIESGSKCRELFVENVAKYIKRINNKDNLNLLIRLPDSKQPNNYDFKRVLRFINTFEKKLGLNTKASELHLIRESDCFFNRHRHSTNAYVLNLNGRWLYSPQTFQLVLLIIRLATNLVVFKSYHNIKNFSDYEEIKKQLTEPVRVDKLIGLKNSERLLLDIQLFRGLIPYLDTILENYDEIFKVKFDVWNLRDNYAIIGLSGISSFIFGSPTDFNICLDVVKMRDNFFNIHKTLTTEHQNDNKRK